MLGGDNLPAHRDARDPYRAPLQTYTWGSNAVKARLGLVLHSFVKYGLSGAPEDEVLAAAESYLHSLHGTNPLGLVYLSNMGAFGAERSANQIFHSWFIGRQRRMGQRRRVDARPGAGVSRRWAEPELRLGRVLPERLRRRQRLWRVRSSLTAPRAAGTEVLPRLQRQLAAQLVGSDGELERLPGGLHPPAVEVRRVTDDGRDLRRLPRAAMSAPRVLIVLGTEAAWSRGVLRGFMAAAQERDWTLLHYYPGGLLDWVADEWAPSAVVFGPELDSQTIARLAPAALVSVTVDRSASRIASVCVDEERIAALALEHLLTRGFRHVSTFRYDESPFAVAREQGFIEQARAAGAGVAPGGATKITPRPSGTNVPRRWWHGCDRCPSLAVFSHAPTAGRARSFATRAKPVCVFPKTLRSIGADNDALECELLSPPLSSVMIPWKEVGRKRRLARPRRTRQAADRGRRAVVSPIAVMRRAALRTCSRSRTHSSPRPSAGFASTSSAGDRDDGVPRGRMAAASAWSAAFAASSTERSSTKSGAPTWKPPSIGSRRRAPAWPKSRN